MLRHLVFFVCVSGGLLEPAAAAEPARVDFARPVQPLLADRCFACHGPDEQTREADLRLDLRTSVFERERDSPLIVPGNSSESSLFERILSHDPDVQMPLPGATRQLSSKETDLIRRRNAASADCDRILPQPSNQFGRWLDPGRVDR